MSRACWPAGSVTVRISGVAMQARAAFRSPVGQHTHGSMNEHDFHREGGACECCAKACAQSVETCGASEVWATELHTYRPGHSDRANAAPKQPRLADVSLGGERRCAFGTRELRHRPGEFAAFRAAAHECEAKYLLLTVLASRMRPTNELRRRCCSPGPAALWLCFSSLSRTDLSACPLASASACMGEAWVIHACLRAASHRAQSMRHGTAHGSDAEQAA